jgi:hypothetical protein
MCFLDNKITPEFSASEEIDQVFSAKDTNFCPFCKKTIAGPRIALVVHFAMVHRTITPRMLKVPALIRKY